MQKSAVVDHRHEDDEDIADESDEMEEMEVTSINSSTIGGPPRKIQKNYIQNSASSSKVKKPNLMETTVTDRNEEEDDDVNIQDSDFDFDEEMAQDTNELDPNAWDDANDIKLDDDGWADEDEDNFDFNDDENMSTPHQKNKAPKKPKIKPDTNEEDSEIIDADGMVPLSSPNIHRQHSYMILDQNAFLQQKDRVIAMTAEVLFVSKDEAECLLRAYGWKNRKLQTDWFDNEKKVRETVGLVSGNDNEISTKINGISTTELSTSSTSSQTSTSDPSSILVQCETAYCDEIPIRNAFALACGHIFCNEDWEGYLSSQIRNGPSCISTTCMGLACKLDHPHKFGCACKQLVPESLFIARVHDKELLDRYRKYVIDSFVEGQKHIRWCPRPGCEYAVSYVAGGTKSVRCMCGHCFCFSCGEDAHSPAPCDLVHKWLIREKNDDATAIWLAAKTKECPKCNVRIEKNKACNHMTCTKCGHGFCWLCKGPWASHGSSTGGYYVCTKYDTDTKEGKYTNEEKTIIENQKVLQKYTYYYKRFKGSADAIRFTTAVGERIEQEMSAKEADLTRYSYLMEAIDKLILARRVLQWTYALAYYFKDGGTKHLFEYQQDMLMGSTEALQDIMDSNAGNLDILSSLRKDIINKISSMDKFRQEMVAQVERGDFEDILLSEADSGMEAWGCVNCRAANAAGKSFCQSCNACRLHGEMECRACKAKEK